MTSLEKIWLKRASQVARRVNLGWFYQKIIPILMVGGFLFAAAILCLRTLHPDWLVYPQIAMAGTVMLLAGGLVAFWSARKHFINRQDGLVRMDDHFSLHNSLTVAGQGLGDWPELPSDESNPGKAGLTWNIPSLVWPLVTTLFLIAASVLVPIPNLQARSQNLPANEPGPWKQMEGWLAELEEEKLIDEDSLEASREKIEELRNQPEDEWFSHSSMEATDSMRDALSRDLKDAHRDLQTLERDLAALQNFAGQMSEEAREMLMKEYDEALKNLGLNNMNLNESLMKQLKDMDLSKLTQEQMKQLSAEQLQKLREKLKNGCT
jgi:hypothetical protein